MVLTKSDTRLTFTQSLAAGSLGGILARTATAPLDVVKVRRQVGTVGSQHSVVKTLQNLYSEGATKTLYRGNLIACCRLIPFSIIHMVAFNNLKLKLVDQCGRLNAHTALMAGGGAGVIATLSLYPTETIKTRLIVQHITPSITSYRGIRDVVRQMLFKEGPGSFYKGAFTTLLGAVPFSAATFFTYESLDALYTKHEIEVGLMSGFINGCIAALVAQSISFPFDTVRKKMQAKSDWLPYRGNVDVKFNSMIGCFLRTVQRHGLRGLWRGCAANALRIVPYNGIMFGTYECCKKACLFYNGYTETAVPLVDDPCPNIDQSFRPHELEQYFEEISLTDPSEWKND